LRKPFILWHNPLVSARAKIEKIIEEKKREMWNWQAKINEARIYVSALEDTLRILPKDPEPGVDIDLRPGTIIYKAREILGAKGEPMHIADLLKALGKPNDNTNRAAVSGSISAYYRKGQIFTRPAPNTFGLVEYPARMQSALQLNGTPKEPPPNFGKDAPDGADDGMAEVRVIDGDVPF
jgi:hypothetical protein